MIAVRCVKCEAEFELADGYAGQRVRCRHCGRMIAVGRQLAPAKAADESPGVHIPDAEALDERMIVKFHCVHCHQKHGVSRAYAGKVVRCSACRKPVRVPSGRGGRTAVAFADEDEGLAHKPPPLELPSTDGYHRRIAEQRLLRRIVGAGVVAAVLLAATLAALPLFGDWSEGRRLAELDREVAALVERAEQARADHDYPAARRSLGEAWARIEASSIAPVKTRDLEARVGAALRAVAREDGRPATLHAGP